MHAIMACWTSAVLYMGTHRRCTGLGRVASGRGNQQVRSQGLRKAQGAVQSDVLDAVRRSKQGQAVGVLLVYNRSCARDNHLC
jgi:hypothetical protein